MIRSGAETPGTSAHRTFVRSGERKGGVGYRERPCPRPSPGGVAPSLTGGTRAWEASADLSMFRLASAACQPLAPRRRGEPPPRQLRSCGARALHDRCSADSASWPPSPGSPLPMPGCKYTRSLAGAGAQGGRGQDHPARQPAPACAGVGVHVAARAGPYRCFQITSPSTRNTTIVTPRIAHAAIAAARRRPAGVAGAPATT